MNRQDLRAQICKKDISFSPLPHHLVFYILAIRQQRADKKKVETRVGARNQDID